MCSVVGIVPFCVRNRFGGHNAVFSISGIIRRQCMLIEVELYVTVQYTTATAECQPDLNGFQK